MASKVGKDESVGLSWTISLEALHENVRNRIVLGRLHEQAWANLGRLFRPSDSTISRLSLQPMGSQVQKSPESSAQFEEHKLSHTDRSDVVRSAADTRDTFTTSFFRAHTRLGESPLYRAEDETLHYIDVLEGNIHVLKLVEPYELHTIRCPEPITFIGFCQSGGYIVCYFQGIAHVDEDGTWHVLKKIIPDAKKHLVRLNDGAIDSRGRLWFGTVDIPGA